MAAMLTLIHFYGTTENLCAAKIQNDFAGAVISRITEKPFNYSKGQQPGIRPMFEYQVEKNIYGGYYYTYGIGFKSLFERSYKVHENYSYYQFGYNMVGETVSQGWQIDTLSTNVGDLTLKNRIRLRYVYLPVGISYCVGEKLSFGVEYSLAFAWSGNYSFDQKFSDVVNNYRDDYSANVGLTTSKKWIHRWDHWIRFSARYKFNNFLFRVGVEKGIRNIFTNGEISGTNNGNPVTLHYKDIVWHNTNIYFGVGVKLPN
jgi:hypothetical protein